MKMLKNFTSFAAKLAFCAIILLFLSSCIETVVVGSTITGAVATREKSLSDTKNDSEIALRIGFSFIENGLKNPGNSVDITVDEGRVLLTGIVRNFDKAKLAQDLCWKVEGVNEVIDETQLREGEKLVVRDFYSAVKDYLITSEVEARLLINRDVRSLNYHISTVDSVVYLFGISQNKNEMNLAVKIASVVKGVNKVVNHLILVDDSRRS